MRLRNALLAVSLSAITSASYAGSATWTTTNHWGNMEWTRAGDFNGDGLTDIVSPIGGTWILKLSNGSNAFTSYYEQFCNNPYSYGNYDWVRVGDFDGNGQDDYLSPTGSTAYLYHFEGPVGGNVCPSLSTVYIDPTWGNAGYTFAGDFNGDGYSDVASAGGSNVYMKFGGPSVESSGFTSATWTVSNQWGQGAYTKAGDFNGDGLTDMASFSGGNAYMKLSTGSGFTSTTWSVNSSWNQGAYTFAGDFNGDLIDDVASCGGSVCYMKQSTGSGFVDPGNEAIDPSWSNAGFTYVGTFDLFPTHNADIASAAYGNVYMKLISP
jgi:hypothetical protein